MVTVKELQELVDQVNKIFEGFEERLQKLEKKPVGRPKKSLDKSE